MAETITLQNTATQINQTISETYSRLIGNYAGPLSASCQSGCGFLIQNGNKQSGLYVANTYFDFYNNNLNFNKNNSDLNFKIYNDRSLNICNNKLIYQLDCNGNVSFGSGLCSSINGIQSYVSHPSLVLNELSQNLNISIQFFNYCKNKTFTIQQNCNSGINFSGNGKIDFYSSNYNTFNIKNSTLAINGNAENWSSYKLYVGGCSIFSDKIFANSGITSNYISCFYSEDVAKTGLDVNTKSVFKNCSNFYCDVYFNSSIYSSGTFNIQNISSTNISGTGYLDYKYGTFENLCVTGGDKLNINVSSNFTCNTCFSADVFFSGDSYFKCSTLNNILIDGSMCHCGSSFIIDPRYPSNHLIKGSTLIICSTGADYVYNLPIYGNIVNISSTGLRANSIETYGDSLNCFSGCLYVLCCIFSPQVNALECVCSPIICSTCCFKSVGPAKILDTLCASVICSSSTTSTNCFESNLSIGNSDQNYINIGGEEGNGFINSVNTSKAWASIKLLSGIPSSFGYNISGVSVTSSSDCLYWQYYEFCLTNPIKYPFSINLSYQPNFIYNIDNNYCSGCLIDNQNGLSNQFIGAYIINCYCSSSSSNSNYCLTSNLTNNCYYCSFRFYFVDCNFLSTPYCELIKSNINGILNININSYL
jgi:hypothetical protein